MSQLLKGRVKNTKTTNAKKNDEKEETREEKKQRLLMEIRALQILIVQAECDIDPTRFADLWSEEINEAAATLGTESSTELVDVEAILQNELCSYAGFCCKNMGGKFAFTFQSLSGNWLTSDNWVQMYKDDEEWKLEQWVMPLGVDAAAVFAKYSMNSDSDMKLFLKECKCLVDSHNLREAQYKRLEVLMSHMERHGCSVEACCGYTNVTLKLLLKPTAMPNEPRKILVQLMYDNDRSRPSKVSVDCEALVELSADCKKELNKYFRCFKHLDLIEAAEKTLAISEGPFLWKEKSADDSIIELNIEEGEEEDFMDSSLSKLLQKKNKIPGDSMIGLSLDDENEAEDSHSSNPSRKKTKVTKKSGRVKTGKMNEVNDLEGSQPPSDKNPKKKNKTVEKLVVSAVGKSTAKKIAAKAKPNPTEEYLPPEDCNDNARSNKVSNETTEETPKKNLKKVESTMLRFLQPKGSKKAESPSPAGGDAKIREKRKASAEMEENENQRKKSRSMTVGSVIAKPDVRSKKILLCSTPIPESVATLSKAAENNISAIAKRDTVDSRRFAQIEDNERADGRSDESDERDATIMEDDHAALLKDLQNVKHNHRATGKVIKKPPKRIVKHSTRGRPKKSES